jgi:DNA-binding PadR family transcriptional regulator
MVSHELNGKDPNLPPLVKIGDYYGPKAPLDVAEIAEEKEALVEMAVKLAATVARFTTEWAGQQLHLSMPMIQDLLIKLAHEGMIEELWQTAKGSSHYKITQQGREYAVRLMEVCAYVGPAPVPLDVYTAMLRWQFDNTAQVKPENIISALSNLVLTKKAMQLAGLAAASGRSLFVYGPPGNGKSSLGRAIREALPGDYWVPYAISVGPSIIRIYDEHCHDTINVPGGPDVVDSRWVRIRRPLVVVGGELTIELLDLIYSPTLKMYEAPPHLKANGGVFLVDDFGRERISPEQLLNRFITPMEHQIDYFTLKTGQKIQLPLRHVLIIATNLSPDKVTDPAFLRRMGYRAYLGPPSAEQYVQIFNSYAQKVGATVPPEVLPRLLEKYKEQNRELRACEPRDLIERSKDICKFHNRPLELTHKVLDLAWMGYFGENLPTAAPSAPPPDEGE